MPLEDYFITYGKQALQPGEFIEAVLIPRPAPDTLIRIVKLSKRFDSDISAVCAAFAITIRKGVVENARVAYGGMAATPKRATAVETALIGKKWNQKTVDAAAAALAADFLPLSDVRGSSVYRLTAAANLIRRLWREQHGMDGAPLLALEPVDG
jgi:xanthine dehydrogenase small subunit